MMTTDPHFVATLHERLLDLLADGKQWSVAQLAKASGVADRRLTKALKALLDSGEVHVAQGGGQGGERYFKRGPAPEKSRPPRTRDATATAPKWPAMDPVIQAAFHAMAAVGQAQKSTGDATAA